MMCSGYFCIHDNVLLCCRAKFWQILVYKAQQIVGDQWEFKITSLPNKQKSLGFYISFSVTFESLLLLQIPWIFTNQFIPRGRATTAYVAMLTEKIVYRDWS